MRTIGGQGVTLTIKGPRQIGKSSLLTRIRAAATAAGKRVALLDFQRIDREDRTDATRFFRRFCEWMTDELEIVSRVDEYWQMPLGNIQRCSRYVERYLLKELNGPLLLALDEVDSISESDFRSDFFGMLRSWHNDRSVRPIWKQLDLAMVTSTEPNQLIENPNQSPFNVGETITLADFSFEQVATLNERHGTPLSPSELQQLWDLAGGHPFLTRRALYVVADQRMSVAALYASAAADDGPFIEHLSHHLRRLQSRADLVAALQQVLRNGTCPDERLFERLQSAGLVLRTGSMVRPRCRLYADYFKSRL